MRATTGGVPERSNEPIRCAAGDLKAFRIVTRVICAYDIAQFTGDTIIDVMRTHPHFIVGGVRQETPFFISPDEFIKELRKRRAHE